MLYHCHSTISDFLSEDHSKFIIEFLVLIFLTGQWSVGQWSMHLVDGRWSVLCDRLVGGFKKTPFLGVFFILFCLLIYLTLTSRFSFLLTILFNNLTSHIFWKKYTPLRDLKREVKHLPCISGRFLSLNIFGTKIFRWSVEQFCKEVACLHVLKAQLI